MNKKKIFFVAPLVFLIALWLSALSFQNTALANDDKCAPTRSYEIDEFVQREYKCPNNNCGTDILHREYRRKKTCWEDECGGSGCSPWAYYHTDPIVYKHLSRWMRCSETDWQISIPSYRCHVECIPFPPPPCSRFSFCADQLIRAEYKCESNDCGTNILRREYRKWLYCWASTCWGGPSGCTPWIRYYTDSAVYKDLEPWLKCNPGQTGWQTKIPTYNCQGVCLDTPINPRYNNSPTDRNVNLRTSLIWDNVAGFRNRQRKGPLSYNITIDNTNTGSRKKESFKLTHYYTDLGYTDIESPPFFSSQPDLDTLKGSPIDGQFVLVNGKYRFIRPTPHRFRTITSCFGKRLAHWLDPDEWRLHRGIDIGHGERCTCLKRGTRFGANVCLDVSCDPWIPIYASAPGIITFVEDGGTSGKMITIDHSAHSFDRLDAAHIKTRYLHLHGFSGSEKYGLIRRDDQVTPEGEIWGIRHAIDPDTGKLMYDDKERPIFKRVQIRSDTILGFMGSTGRSTGAHLHFDIILNGKKVDPLLLITIPAQYQWIGDVPCLEQRRAVIGLRNVLEVYAAIIGGDEKTHDPKEEFYPAKLSYPYQEVGNPFSTNLKTNRLLAENCLLRPSDSYNWTVQACCNMDGTNCGKPSDWAMTTSDSTEAIRQGTERGTRDIPEIIYRLEDANLRWCDTRFKETAMIGGQKQVTHFYPDRYEVIVEQKLPRFQLWGFGLFQTFQCHPLLYGDGKCNPVFRVAAPPHQPSPPTHLKNEESLLFTKGDYAHYRWKVRACRGEADCNEFSPWRYIKVSDEVTVLAPYLMHPSNDPNGETPIGWPITFRWKASLGANSYVFELYDGNKRIIRKLVESAPGIGGEITRIHDVILPKDVKGFNFSLDTSYRWRVKSCWDTRATEEFCEKEWSERHFRTTGHPPVLRSPGAGEEKVLIPLTLEWKKVSGAGSYILKLNGKGTIVRSSWATFNHLDVKQNTSYTWSVRSCNDAAGQVCGKESEVRTFRTIKLEPPQNLTPPRADYFTDQHRSITLSWDLVAGASYYNLSVFCGEKEILNVITKSSKKTMALTCIGGHRWQVSACIDANCLEKGESSENTFILHEGKMRGGFVPCGLDFNNPKTPWNERDPCQLRHIFIMLKTILDFLFWNLMPLVLVVMMAVSGVLFYTSLGNPQVITQIKGIWKSVGKGLAIMFLGWTLITIIMAIMGYTGIFGPWWQIHF